MRIVPLALGLALLAPLALASSDYGSGGVAPGANGAVKNTTSTPSESTSAGTGLSGAAWIVILVVGAIMIALLLTMANRRSRLRP